MTEIKFNGRTPVPPSIPIGVTGDRDSQEVRFSFDRALSGSLFLKLSQDDYCDKIPLPHDGSSAVWKVGQPAAARGGRVFGQLQLEDADGGVWQSYQFSLNISGSIAADEMIGEAYPSVLTDLERRLALVEEFGSGLPGEKGDPGEPGAKGEKGDPGEKGEKGEPGEPGRDGTAMRILGRLDSADELPEEPQAGDGYLINGELWTATGDQWINAGPVQGPKGEKGDPGESGAKGEKGDPGESGAKGEKGDPGEPGAKGEKGDPGDVNCYTRYESDERYAPLSSTRAFPFIIPVEAWVSSEQIDYPFEASVAAAGVTGSDLVRADFDIASLAVTAEARVAAAGDTSAGLLTFYAKTVPDSAIGGLYTIHRTVG